jgi:O-antigen/teichoic acid export membrane protein
MRAGSALGSRMRHFMIEKYRELAPTTAAASIVSGSIKSMGTRVAGLLVALLSQLYLARLLGVSEFGRYAIALGWTMLLVILVRRGLDDMAVRMATHYWEEGQRGELAGLIRYAVRTMTITWLALVGVAAAAKLILGDLGSGFSWPMIVAVALTVFPLAILGLYSALLLVSGRVIASQAFEQVCRPLVLIGLLVLIQALLTGPFLAATAMFLTAASVGTAMIAARWVWRRAFRGAEISAITAHLGEWHSVSASFVVMAVAQEGLNQAGVLLLGIVGTNVEAAHFSAAWRYNSFLAFGLVAVAAVSGPRIASAYRRSDRAELASIVRTGARISLGFAAIGALVLVFFGRTLLALFGLSFTGAYPALLILLVGSLANASTGAVSYLLSLTGSHQVTAKVILSALVICIALNSVLIPRMGIMGAAIAGALTQVFWNVTLVFWARRRTGVLSFALSRGLN